MHEEKASFETQAPRPFYVLKTELRNLLKDFLGHWGAIVGGIILFLYLAGIVQPWIIQHRSMIPTIYPNDLVVSVTPRLNPINTGDIIAFRIPGQQWFVKRVCSIDENGWMDVRGDNPDESVDSRIYGKIPPEYVRGKIIWIYERGAREGK